MNNDMKKEFIVNAIEKINNEDVINFLYGFTGQALNYQENKQKKR